MAQHDFRLRSLKAQTYRYGNRAGKLLANQLKEKSIKQRISYIVNPKTELKVTNPKGIADAFSEYYEELFNLNNDPNTHQPTEKTITEFLASVNLPILSQKDLQSLNQPFTVQEIEKAIKKSPP